MFNCCDHYQQKEFKIAAKPGVHASLARYFRSLKQHLSDLNVLLGGENYFTTFHIIKDLILVYR